MGPDAIPDDRLPDAGERVIVDLPRAVRGDRPRGTYRLTSRDDLKVRLVSEEGSVPVPVGVPIAITWGRFPQHLVGTVVAVPEAHVLDVILDPPAQARRFPRYHIHLPATLELFQSADAAALSCIVVDLSRGGFRASVGVRIPSDTPAFASIELPRLGTVLAIAEVLDCTLPPHENVYEVRLRFRHLSDENAGRISEFLGDLER